MKDDIENRVFARNLNHYVSQSGKQQKEIAKALGYSEKTFNGWCRGISIPTMGKVQKLADYFGIGKSDLLEDKKISDLADPNKAKLLAYYDSFSESGRAELLKYAKLLSDSGNYKKGKSEDSSEDRLA